VGQALQGEQWAAPLQRKIEQNGGISSAPMPLLLEIRIAYAFQQNSVEPQYEFAAGSGTKSNGRKPNITTKLFDFHVHGSPEWLIEVVSLRESYAIKDATLRDGLLTFVILSSLSADPKQSEEGEVVRAMEHIADKAEKFPIPSPGAFHLMADHHDFREIAYGAASAVREECRHYWNGHPVAGVFDTRNARRSARLVQTRVHFLGFLKEKHYCKGEIERIGYYLPNPGLLSTDEEAATTFLSFPLGHRPCKPFWKVLSALIDRLDPRLSQDSAVKNGLDSLRV
jgi:hypothetical protein